jgi:hypothetical protein
MLKCQSSRRGWIIAETRSGLFVMYPLPLFLGAGDYTIGGFYPRKEKSKDVDPIAIAFRNVATAPGVTFEGGRSTFGLRFPIGDQLFGFPEGNSYFGPNSQFVPANTVPDGRRRRAHRSGR